MKRLSVYLFALLIAIGGVACSERSDNQPMEENQEPFEMERDTAGQDTVGQDTLGSE